MQLCSLSVDYACPYHNPTTTVGHSVHNVNISKPLAHTKAIHVVYGCEACCQILKNNVWGGLYIQLSGNSSDGPSFSMQIALSLKTWDFCGIVLCDKTTHFRVAFYCPQHKVHLCNDRAV